MKINLWNGNNMRFVDACIKFIQFVLILCVIVSDLSDCLHNLEEDAILVPAAVHSGQVMRELVRTRLLCWCHALRFLLQDHEWSITLKHEDWHWKYFLSAIVMLCYIFYLLLLWPDGRGSSSWGPRRCPRTGHGQDTSDKWRGREHSSCHSPLHL